MTIEISQPLDYATRQPIPDLIEVRFRWHTRNGFCLDCGLPAAYFAARWAPISAEECKLCSVCAANDAADGMDIRRIEAEEE